VDDTETTTTVNIKAIKVAAWERAKTAAGRNDETLGNWVSRACEQLAAAEAGGPRLYPPATPDLDLGECRAWAEVLVSLHNAGKPPPQWLTTGIFRKAATALGVPPPAPRRRLQRDRGHSAPANGASDANILPAPDSLA
jgi:hypothetical protein